MIKSLFFLPFSRFKIGTVGKYALHYTSILTLLEAQVYLPGPVVPAGTHQRTSLRAQATSPAWTAMPAPGPPCFQSHRQSQTPCPETVRVPTRVRINRLITMVIIIINMRKQNQAEYYRSICIIGYYNQWCITNDAYRPVVLRLILL